MTRPPDLTPEQARLASVFANLHTAYDQTKQVRLKELWEARMVALSDALEAGVPCRTLATRAGLSPGRLHQLRNELEGRKP